MPLQSCSSSEMTRKEVAYLLAMALVAVTDDDLPAIPCPAGWIRAPGHPDADHRGCRVTGVLN